MGKRPIIGMLGLAWVGIALAAVTGCGECCRNTRPNDKPAGVWGKGTPAHTPPPMIGDAKAPPKGDFAGAKPAEIVPVGGTAPAGGGVVPADRGFPSGGSPGVVEANRLPTPATPVNGPFGEVRRETMPPAQPVNDRFNMPAPPMGRPAPATFSGGAPGLPVRNELPAGDRAVTLPPLDKNTGAPTLSPAGTGRLGDATPPPSGPAGSGTWLPPAGSTPPPAGVAPGGATSPPPALGGSPMAGPPGIGG